MNHDDICKRLSINEKEHKEIYELFGQVIKTANTMSNTIIELYGKIDILTKRVEELERGTKTETCPICEGNGYIEVEPGAFCDCNVCRGTGKINVMINL